MNISKFSRLYLGPVFILITGVILSVDDSYQGFRTPAGDDDAYSLYQKLRYDAFDDVGPTRLRVLGTETTTNQGLITFGAEKEGSTSRLTRVAGPKSKHFAETVESMSEESQESFLKSFLSEIAEAGPKTVEALDGSTITSSVPSPSQVASADSAQLKGYFQAWIESTKERPFSFISLNLRKRIYDGNFAGMDGSAKNLLRSYPGNWTGHFGEAEKYMGGFSKQMSIDLGWEINFAPMDTYAEFEEMIRWFKDVMAPGAQQFESPGHHRLVFPKPSFVDDSAKKAFREGLAETYKLSQAYVIMRGIKGKTGINVGQWKFVMPDTMINSLNKRANHIFRLEVDHIASDTMSLEMRAGTKDAPVQRFVQQVVGARIATHDFSDLSEGSSWTLLKSQNAGNGYPDTGNPNFNSSTLYNIDETAQRFDLDAQTINKAFDNIKSVENQNSAGWVKKTFIQPEFWVPLWQWEDAPFVSSLKKNQLKDVTKSFLQSMAALEEPSLRDVQELFSDWVKVSKLTDDIEDYLRPKMKGSILANADQFKIPPGAFDVNKVDLGVEFTGRFPIQNELHFTEDRLEDGKYHWLATAYDLTPEEREQSIEKLAKNISKELGGSDSNVTKLVNEGSHGHALGIAFEITDPQNKKWRVEWDGIGRSYDPAGNVIENSGRGGHIEIVSPKDNIDYKTIDKVYTALRETGTLPRYSMGGSHINIDLAAFENNPKALARFMSIFHEHRGVMALMYQHPGRIPGSEPAEISNSLAQALSNFQGSDDELKKLLYNEKYFNTRVGRKTRYLQLDVGSYFQDAIPDKYITDDFDINNPQVPWRRQFRVEPNIRKMEFRMFGAPESSADAAMQVKLVRAMMNKALNSDEPLNAKVQEVNYRKYLENPAAAWQDVKKMAQDLGLDPEDYKQALGRGLQESEQYFSTSFPKYDEKLRDYPKYPHWDGALDQPRGATNAIGSSGREWSGSPVPEAAELQQRKIRIAQELAQTRSSPVLSRRVRLARSDMSCSEVFRYLVNAF